ncbi:hypothetical protein BDV19DRAFT_383820 [Aspergillus venezuelensis]
MATLKTDVDFNESRAVEVNVVGWVFTGTAIATVALKVAARHMGLSIIAAALVSYSVTLGLGRHTAAVVAEHGMERVTKTAYWQILGFPFNIGSFSFPNISIAILINNLLDPNPLRSRLLLGMSILQVIFALISVILIFAQCKPTAALWDHSIQGHCWPQHIFYDFMYWTSAYTAMTDIILAIVPITVFWKLQMRRSTKIGVCIMMGLTLLSAVVTIVKATYLPLFTDIEDPLYNVTPLVVWGLIEQNVVIVAACIPTLRPFFRRAFESRESSNNTSSRRTGSAIKLSSNPSGIRSKRGPSTTEIDLQETQVHDDYGDRGSNNSRQGIWQTREVIVESDDEKDVEGGRRRDMRNVVPMNLR